MECRSIFGYLNMYKNKSVCKTKNNFCNVCLLKLQISDEIRFQATDLLILASILDPHHQLSGNRNMVFLISFLIRKLEEFEIDEVVVDTLREKQQLKINNVPYLFNTAQHTR